ncbi:hypothetical protein Tco_1251752 [Tanacetum coccineum]
MVVTSTRAFSISSEISVAQWLTKFHSRRQLGYQANIKTSVLKFRLEVQDKALIELKFEARLKCGFISSLKLRCSSLFIFAGM